MDKLYICNTVSPEYKETLDTMRVQDGFETITLAKRDEVTGDIEDIQVTVPKMITIPNRMSRECKYDRTDIDPQCKGCDRRIQTL